LIRRKVGGDTEKQSLLKLKHDLDLIQK